MDNKFTVKGMTAQRKLILQGFILSTILLVFIAGLAVFNIQQNLNTGYKNFGQILSKTLAIESVEITKDIPEAAKAETLRAHSDSILRSNEDIAFIEFRDANSKVIYSSRDSYYNQAQKAQISVSSPMIAKTPSGSTVVGSVMVGLSGTIIDNISTTTRASLIFAFVVAWLAVIAIVFMDTILITRELKQLHEGVQKISSGEFGYNIECKDSSREIQELCDAFNRMSNRLSKYNEQTMESITLERNKLEVELCGIKFSLDTDTSSQELMDYFIGNKQLIFDKSEDDYITYWVKGELTYWDEEEAKSYIATRGGYLYEHCSENGIDKGKYSKLLTEIFVNRTIKVMMCASYRFVFSGESVNIEINQDGHKPDELSDYMKNPHSMGFSCWGSHINNVEHALSCGDFVGAVAATIAATDDLTIHDAGCSKFCKWLCESNEACLLMTDGRHLTCQQYIDEQK